jgi:cytochrome P450
MEFLLVHTTHRAEWYGPNLPLTTSGHAWRDRRRVVENNFRPAATQKYRQVQQDKAVDLLKRIVKNTNAIADHTRE